MRVSISKPFIRLESCKEYVKWKGRIIINLSTKVFLITFTLIFSLILLLSFLYQNNSANILIDSQTEFAHQLVQKSDEQMELTLKSIESFLLSIAKDELIVSGSFRELEKWLNENLIYFIPNAKNIYLIEDRKVLVSTSPIGWRLEEDRLLLDQLAQVDKVGIVYWSNTYFSSVSENTITAIMKIPDETIEKFLVLDIDLQKLYESLVDSTAAISTRGDLLLFDYGNELIYGKRPFAVFNVFTKEWELLDFKQSLLEQDWTMIESKSDTKELLFFRSQANTLGWQVVWVMDKSDMIGPLRANMRISWVMIGLTIALSLIIAWAITLLISRPIKKIADSMIHVGDGQWDTHIPLQSRDELGMLARRFNQMTAKIRELIADLQHTEKAKKESDFRALQTQIRPHFLFNTLNTISIAAKEHQTEKVDTLISSLTNSIHYSLDHSPAPVTLSSELHALRSYIDLMQIRYDHRFTVDMDIDPAALELTLPKFTLQPLVENSIFHGLVLKESGGTLFIGATRYQNTWDIIIEDTGLGIEEEQLKALKERLKLAEVEQFETRHIGMSNVHHRLKLTYGDRYHIHISSTVGQGTQIVLSLPIHYD